MKSCSEIQEIKIRLKEAYNIICSKPKASHEDVRGAFSKVFEFLGYPEKNRLHERASKAGKCDLRLITDEGLVYAIVEFKKPGAPLEEDKFREYMYDLRVNYGVFTDGKILKMYEIMLDELKELGSLIRLEDPEDTAVTIFYDRFRKPESPLTPKRLLEFLGGIEERPIPLAENIEEFISKFRLSPTPFAELVSSTFLLYKSLAIDPSSFAAKTFKIWRKYFAPTLKEKGGEKKFKEWRETLKIMLRKDPSADELYEYMFALETAYALVSRLILLRFCGDYDFGVGVTWMKDLMRDILRDSLLKTLSGSGLHTYIAGQIPRQFERLSYDFPSVFEEDFFDWWHDAIYRPAPRIEDIIQGTIPKPVTDFTSSLLKVTFIVSSFSFKDITSDILGTLYQEYFDTTTRKALGEFYTPPDIVEYILDSVGYSIGEGISWGKTLIDPACGSGTFLIKALGRYLKEAEERVKLKKISWEVFLTNLCDGLAICGLDINPFAVMIAQVNYSMQIIPFYREARQKNPYYRISGIPVFKTDTLRLPGGGSPLTKELLSIQLPIGDGDKVEFLVPSMKILRDVGALNPAEAVKLLRMIYRATRRAALPGENLDGTLTRELEKKVYDTIKANEGLMTAIKSIVACLKDLKDRVGDSRLTKWVGDELIVGTIKSEILFDFTVFNPPYVTAYRTTEEQWAEYERYEYKLLKGAGKRDLAYLFIEWSLNRLNDGGKLGCIITDKWIEWEGRSKIRDLVLDNTKVIEIVDSMWVKFFEEARNYVSIITLEKTKEWDLNEPLRFASTFKEPQVGLKGSLNEIKNRLDSLEDEYWKSGECSYLGEYYVANVWASKRIKESSHHNSPWSPFLRLTVKEVDVLSKLEAMNMRLENVKDFVEEGGRRFFEGIVTAGHPVLFLTESEAETLGSEVNSTTKITAEGADIERWSLIHKQKGVKEVAFEPCGHVNWRLVKKSSLMKEKRIIFPYTWSGSEWQRINITKYSLAKSLVVRKAGEAIKNRGKRVEAPVKFLIGILESNELHYIDKRGDVYVERKPLKVLSLQTPRLICRDSSRWNSWVLDSNAEVYPVNTCYFIVLKYNDIKKSAYYLGLLNSTVLEFYHKSWAPTLAGATFRYRVETVHKYPIIPYQDVEIGMKDQIVELVGELLTLMINLKEKVLILQEFIENPAKAARMYVEPSMDFSATEEIEINLKDIVIRVPRPLRKTDEEELNRAVRIVHSKLVDLAKIICGKEQELNNYTMKLYNLTPEDMFMINAYLKRLRLWEVEEAQKESVVNAP